MEGGLEMWDACVSGAHSSLSFFLSLPLSLIYRYAVYLLAGKA